MVLKIKEQNFYDLFECTNDGVIILDVNGKIVSKNSVAQKYLQNSDGEGFLLCHETHICVNNDGEDICERECPVKSVVGSGVKMDNFCFTAQFDGNKYSFPAVCVPLVLGDENLAALVFHDTSVESSFKEQLLLQARQDQLTGLSNRQYFDELYNHEVIRLNRHGGSFTGAVLEITNLKEVNEKYGTSKGDVLIRAVGEVLSKTLRKVDVACRYSGSKFGIIFAGTSEIGAQKSLQRVMVMVEQVSVEGIPHDDISIKIGMESSNQQFENVMKNAEESVK